jgi:hypothetical protein
MIFLGERWLAEREWPERAPGLHPAEPDLGKPGRARDHVGMAKSSCSLSKSQFLAKAEPMKISIQGQDMLAEVKAFSTGSFGWYLNGKTTVMVDGKPLSIQIGMNLTVVGSKEAPRDA